MVETLPIAGELLMISRLCEESPRVYSLGEPPMPLLVRKNQSKQRTAWNVELSVDKNDRRMKRISVQRVRVTLLSTYVRYVPSRHVLLLCCRVTNYPGSMLPAWRI
jgi:hypothetical protein